MKKAKNQKKKKKSNFCQICESGLSSFSLESNREVKQDCRNVYNKKYLWNPVVAIL